MWIYPEKFLGESLTDSRGNLYSLTLEGIIEDVIGALAFKHWSWVMVHPVLYFLRVTLAYFSHTLTFRDVTADQLVCVFIGATLTTGIWVAVKDGGAGQYSKLYGRSFS